jgi:tetratricopeptide (TPR) repeat protein
MKQHIVERPSPRPGRRRFLAAGLALLLLSAAGVILFRSLFTPPEFEQIYRVGIEAASQGDLGTTQVAAEALAGLEEAQAQSHVLEGFIHLRSGRLKEAAAELQQALENPQTAPMANMLAGEALYRNRQFQEAIRVLSSAVQQDNSLIDAHRRLAAVLYDIGATEEAVVHLRIVSQQAPDDPRPHRLMGLIYKDMEVYETAVTEYREALRRDPNLPGREEVLLELATCLLKTRNFKDFGEVVAQCPASADTLAMRAEAQFNQGNATDAAALVAEALRLAPDHLETLLIKGTIFLSQGSAEEAAATLARAAELHPLDYRVHHKLSQAYARLGRKEQARAQSDEAERFRNLRIRFADLHAKASINTGDAELRYQLGVMARELQREDLAISWFSAATALDPDHVAAREALRAGPPAAAGKDVTDQATGKKNE